MDMRHKTTKRGEGRRHDDKRLIVLQKCSLEGTVDRNKSDGTYTRTEDGERI